MFRLIIIFFLLKFSTPAFASIEEKIISQIKLIDNLSFNFVQTINDKSENGICIIKYPKKIYCEYNNSNKKIIISDGKSLIIKNKKSKNYYTYPLKKTPLKFLLDKDYLISKIDTLRVKNIDNKYLNFKIIENNNEINVFFDKKTLVLTGWQTEDIYQNLTITYISSVKINEEINNKIFTLPENK